MAATKIKGLQQWCRRMTEGYDHVDISNFTSSWRDGMAFSALIHRFRPDLIDYDSLSPENVFENCKLIFEIAEQELDIPAFLEAEDMARLKAPDKLSVITYVSQYYNILNPLPQLGGPGVRGKVSNKIVSGTKRPTDSDSSYAPSTKRAPVMATKENAEPAKEKAASAATGDVCGICHNRVYLLERHMEGGKLYHRSCFRHSELSPTNKVYTRSPYLSPSLNSETSSFTYPSTNSTGVLSDVAMAGNDKNHQVATETKTASETSTVAKKLEVVGTKHQLGDHALESTKKSKLQSNASLDEEKLKKTLAIKDRLQSMKTKYSFNRSSDNSLPLSGKEARKLEKKREEILASQTPAEELMKVAKRNLPLILQQNDKLTSSSSKSGLIVPASTTSSSSITLATKTATTSKSASVKLSTSTASHVSVSTKSDSQIAHSRFKPTDVKNNEKSTVGKLDIALLKKNTLSNPQKAIVDKFTELSKPSHPVAKPRTAAPLSVGKGSREEAALAKPVLKTSTELRDKPITPKPVPRKSMLESSAKASAPEHSKIPTLDTVPAIDELDSSKLSTASSAPPLPASAPPPLPTSGPVDDIISVTDKGVRKSSHELILQQTKSSVYSKTHAGERNSISTASISLDLHQKADPIKVTAHERTSRNHSDKFVTEHSSAHAIMKSSATDITEAEAQITSTPVPQDRRWSSSSISTNQSQMALHVMAAPNENKEQAPSDLPTSLSWVKIRKPSSPVSCDLNRSLITSPPVSSLVPAIEPLSADSEMNTETSFTASSRTPVNEASTFNTPALDMLSYGELVSGTSSTVSKQDFATKDFNLIIPETLNNESSQLDSFQDMDKYSKETSKTRVSSLNVINENNNANFESRNIQNLITENTEKKQENEGSTSDSDRNSLHSTPAKHIISSDEAKSTSSRKQNAVSSSKKDCNVSSISLKQANLEQKKSNDEPLQVTHNLNTVKGNAKCESGPQKPPRLLKMSKLASHENYEDTHKIMDRNIDETQENKLDSSVSDVIAGGVAHMSSASSAIMPQSETAIIEQADSVTDLPQWKKDIEERKKKLREDIAKSESETHKLKHLREKGVRKAKNSDISAPKENTSEKLVFPISLESDEEIKNSESTVSSSSENIYSINSLQKESEKKMTPLTGSDNEQKDNWKKTSKEQKASSSIEDNVNSYQTHEDTVLCGLEDVSQVRNKTRLHSHGDQKADNQSMTQGKVTVNNLSKKKAAKLKDSELEFSVSKTKLRSVEVDIDILSTEESEVASNNNTHGKQVKNVQDEGDEEVMQHLKHVSKINDVSITMIKTHNGADVKSDAATNCIHPSVLTNSSLNGNGNNNKTTQLESTHASDKEHFQKLNVILPKALKSVDSDNSEKSKTDGDEDEKKQNSKNKSVHSESAHASDLDYVRKQNMKGGALFETVDLDRLEYAQPDKGEDMGNRRISVLSQEKLVLQTRKGDEDKDKETSPKVRRKITVLGRKGQNAGKSPPTSPLPMRKIEVTTKFNFEESSSDFQISLTQSTAKLTIHDKSAPPPRPPPPRLHHHTVLPLQISAIELQQQLLDIDSRLTDLELRGRDLEESIRHENTLDGDDDVAINDWFRLVSERNELVRKEADLVYISKQQDLEDEQEHIESQLRYLISKPDDLKSGDEKQEEEYLIKRKLELVEQRSKIVDSMDEDRIRYETEDRDIKIMKETGLWRNSTGTIGKVKEKKVSMSVFYS